MYYIAHRDEILAKRKAKWQARNTEEFRAERRRKYAEKHANDPMTEHRRRCIEAAQERMTITLEERKAKNIAKLAEEVARKDIQKTYGQGEEESIRKRETVIKYIYQWTKRKIFATTTEKNGEFMSEADVRAYYREALRYFELEKRLQQTDQRDYSTRNILSYKMRCIEDRFNELLNKRYNIKAKLKL